MKPFNTFLTGLLLIIGLTKSQAQFQKTYGLENDDLGIALLKANDSSFYLIGAYSYVSKIDISGNIYWEKEIRQKDDWYYTIFSDALNTDSTNFLILGNNYNKSGNKENIFIAKLNLTGDTIWTQSYGNPLRYCNARRIISTKDGGLAIIGNGSLIDWRYRDLLFIKTDSAGKVICSKTYGGESHEDGIALSETDNGDFILVGLTESYGEGGKDIYVLKINSIGDTIWTKTIGGQRNDYPSDIIKTLSDEYIITGTTSSYGEYYHDDDLFLLKIDGYGNIVWSQTYGGVEDESSIRLIQTSDTNFLVIGNTQSSGFGQEDIFLIKTDNEGDTILTKAYGGASNDNGKYIIEVAAGYYLLGDSRSFSAGGKDICVVHINESGNSTCRFKETKTAISNPAWKVHSGSIRSDGPTNEISNLLFANVSFQINDMCECILPIAKFEAFPVDGWVNFEDKSTWADTWFWDFGDGESSTEQNPGHFVREEANICLTVQNQCGTDTYCEIVYGGAEIEEDLQSALINPFPIPSKDFIFIKLEENIRINSIFISDISGNEIMQIKITNQNLLKINVGMLSKGIYLLKLLTIDNKLMAKKIIIE